MKHVALLQDSTCSINFVVYILELNCVIGSVVTHRRTNAKNASSRLDQSGGLLLYLKIVFNVCARIYIIDIIMYMLIDLIIK